MNKESRITKCIDCGYQTFQIGNNPLCKRCGGKLEILAQELEEKDEKA
jgi:rRNA maturation endonuclease Nob1